MLVLLGVTLALLAAAGLAGAAVWRLAGWTHGRCLAPAAGMAALLLVAAEAVRLPGGASTAAVACGALVLAGAVGLVPVRKPSGRGARQDLILSTAAAGLTLLVACLPFAASGRTGILGAGDDNDSSVHLGTAWALVHGLPDSPNLAGHGYPIGPHALVAALDRGLGTSLPDGFTALSLAAPVLAAVAALAALDGLAPALRVAAAALVGMPYLMAAYLAQGAFKDQLQALLMLCFALALANSSAWRSDVGRPDARASRSDAGARSDAARSDAGGRSHAGDTVRRRGAVLVARARAGTPLGILAAATLVVYSLPGLAWPAAGVTAAGLLALALGRMTLPALLRAARAPALGTGLVVATVALAEASRLAGFASSSFAHEPAGGLGNLLAPIPAWEALGIWLRPDFRLAPHPELLRLAPALAAAGLGLWALVGRLRRGEVAIVGALGGATAIAVIVAATRNPYNAAKPLVVVAPLVTLVLAGSLRHRGGEAARVRRVAAASLLALAAVSSVLALRDAPVGPADHSRALQALRLRVGTAPTLYLGTDDFAGWWLRGAVLGRPVALYPGWTVPLRADLPYGGGGAVHPGLIDAATLDRFTFLITPLSGYDPAPPPNFHLVWKGGGYGLWQRHGPTPERYLPGDDPAGGVLDCSDDQTRGLLHVGGSALVAPAPVVGPASGWSVRRPGAGRSSRQSVMLSSAGDWTLSLQYASTRPLRLQAPGLDVVLPASLDRLGPHWLVGTLRSPRAGPVTLTLTPERVPLVGRLLLARGLTRAQDSSDGLPLGEVALVAHRPPPRRVALGRACGQWVRSVQLAS